MKIIILDDSHVIQQIIKIHLDELNVEEQEIESFGNGNEALSYIKENDADIVFCDINMPQMNGDEFAKKLFQFRPDLKKSFFVISATDDNEDIQKMKDVGAKRFLKKPIDENKFNHFIKIEIERIRLKAKNSEITLQHQKEMIDKHIIISQTDLGGRIIYVSKAFSEISGYTKTELIGSPHKIVKHPDMESKLFESVWKTLKAGNEWHGEIKNLRKDGSSYWVDSTISPVYDENNNKIGYTSVRIDITDKKRVEELLRIDVLTGAYNRRSFNELFQRRLFSSIRNDKVFTFALLDIDHFKQYNDTYGHPSGDLALKTVSQLVMKLLKRSDDYFFRLGGEEFGVIYESNSKDAAISFADKIRKSIEELMIDHSENSASKFLNVSIGVVPILKLSGDISQSSIFKQADELLYLAKNNGRNRIEVQH